MVQDKARHLVPDRAVWNAYDAFLAEDGTLTQRGGALTGGANNVVSPAHIAILKSNEADGLVTALLYDESGGVGAMVKTAAFPIVAGTITITVPLTLTAPTGPGWATPTGGGRPARYFNRVLRPNGIPASISAAHGYRAFSAWAGAQHTAGKTSRTSASVITAVAGDNVLTGFSVADTGAMEVGNIVNLVSAAGNTYYYGRIVAIPTTTTLQVSPVPSAGLVTAAGGWIVESTSCPRVRSAATSWICGARALTVWGNRVILGGVAYDLLGAGTKLDIKANRICWSILPVVESAVVNGNTYDGYRELGVETFLPLDFQDVMGMETILGLEPVNDNELLVLGAPRIHRIVGYFSTQTTQVGGGLTWDVRPVQDAVECISDAATATTPVGIMFAAPDGIYLYRGGRAVNVMDGRIRNLWIAGLDAGATVTGGGYIGNNHYYVSTSAGAFHCDLDQFRWTISGMSSIGGVAGDPVRPGRFWGHRKNPGTTLDSSKVFRMDTILRPSVANSVDAHSGWGGPSLRLETRAYTEGDHNREKRFQHVYVHLRLVTAGTVTVTAMPGIDAEETPVVLGTFSSSANAQEKVFQMTTNSRAIAIKIERTAGAPSLLEVIGLKITSVPLNEFRVAP
jgi:hypothetical protein